MRLWAPTTSGVLFPVYITTAARPGSTFIIFILSLISSSLSLLGFLFRFFGVIIMSAPETSSYDGRDDHPDSEEDVFDMPRTPRRTPMACQFCRGRKLKCDGRQTCSNCHRRGIACTYLPVGQAQK